MKRVKAGQTLSTPAKHYRISVERIRSGASYLVTAEYAATEAEARRACQQIAAEYRKAGYQTLGNPTSGYEVVGSQTFIDYERVAVPA